MIYDDLQGKNISEISFQDEIKAVKLNQIHLFVLTKKKVITINLQTLKTINTTDTINNPRGVFSMVFHDNKSVIAFPNEKKGNITVQTYDNKGNKKDFTFWAHTSAIGCLSLNKDGSLIATASENGTLIRVFKADTGDIGYNFRRGADKAEIYSLCFDDASDFIGCTSDRSTVHIFSLKIVSDTPGQEGETDDEIQNKRNSVFKKSQSHEGFFGQLTRLISMPSSYITDRRSFAQFRIPSLKSICSFSNVEANNFFVITTDGKFYNVSFDPTVGGDCKDNFKGFDILSE